jgi:hypothetical protein
MKRSFPYKQIRSFDDIPMLMIYDQGNMWHANYGLERIDLWHDGDNDHHIVLNPDFQRGHVWTKDQQIAFVEHVLRGGKGCLHMIFNAPNHDLRSYTCVDGLQRLTAVWKFMHNELMVFGDKTCLDLSKATKRTGGKFPWSTYQFDVHVIHIDSKAELLRFYLELNDGGTPHTREELDRVRRLLVKAENT